jgi:mRNA interferase YafQ
MRKVEYPGQFKRDVKKAKKRGKDLEKMKHPMTLLINGENLPQEYLDHPLKATGKGVETYT